MLATTDAIVLALQPLSDKAHILHTYTRADGRVNYKVYGLGRKHPIGLYTPLSRTQITADFPLSGMPRLREISSSDHHGSHASLQTDPYKRTIALFISEVLYHTLPHPMSDEVMFDFLDHSIQALEQTSDPTNFHLLFLIRLASKLGFAMPFEPPLPTTRTERQTLLYQLCEYFQQHVETWQNPRSLEVLMAVFD